MRTGAGPDGTPPASGGPSEADRASELERQNDALRHASEQLDLLREQYSDLYDYAPVGYVTVDDRSIVHRANLVAAAMLGVARGDVAGTRLLSYVSPADRTACAAFLKDVFTASAPSACEVALVKGRWRAEHVQLVAAPAATGRDLGHAGPQARIALVDVSQRRKAEEAARDGERRLEAVVEAMAEGVVVFDAAGRIESCNTAAERILDATAEEMRGRTSLSGVAEAIHEDGSPFAAEEQPAAVVLRTGQARWNVLLGLPRDAGTTWIRASAEPIRDAGRRVRGAVTTLEDVTVARALEVELRESRTRLDRVLAAASDGYWEWEPRTGRARFSPRMSAILGGPEVQTETLVATWPERVDPEHRGRVKAGIEGVVSGALERIDDEYPVRIAGGASRWLRIKGDAVSRDRDGRPELLAGTVRDVTAFKEAGAAFRRSESLHRAIAHGIPGGAVFLVAPDLRVVLADGPALEQEGLHREQLEGMHLDGAPLGFDLTPYVSAVHAAFRGETSSFERFRPGRTYAVRVAPVRDPRGEVFLALVSATDVTQVKRAAETVAVQARLASLGTLVGGIAHQINNPLAGALANVGSVVEDLRERAAALASGIRVDRDTAIRDLEDDVEALEGARESIQRIAQVVRELTTMVRPGVRRDRVRLSEVVHGALRWLSPTVGARADVRVERSEAPEVLGSPHQLEQVVAHLVENGALSMPDGRRGTVVIRVGSTRSRCAFVEVKDDGKGMAPEVLGQVFDPFFTTQAVGRGKGLGLSIAHAIVTAHGGTIEATSTPGAGSTFRFELPLAPDAVGAA
ncbi:MAG: PAS domain-containing protein [Anaeromyxobacteraceae bacterium]